MSSKPSIFALAGDSKNFVFSNAGFLKKTILVFFPMIFALAAIGMIGKYLGWPLFPHVLFIPYFIVYGCYILSWHRTCLIADGENHIVTPFSARKGDIKFLVFFVMLSLFLWGAIFSVDWVARMYITDNLYRMNEAHIKTLLGSTLVFDFLCVYVFTRLSFVLPAQSVGHTLDFQEVMKSSQGMVWRLIGADIIFILLLGILVVLYSMVALQIIGVAVNGTKDISMAKQIIVSLMLVAPIQLVILVTMSLMTTALSKAYRWGMENNPAV